MDGGPGLGRDKVLRQDPGEIPSYSILYIGLWYPRCLLRLIWIKLLVPSFLFPRGVLSDSRLLLSELEMDAGAGLGFGHRLLDLHGPVATKV